ncbi:3'(2'),5'-bisphosphate nucleotidase CysQ family protein [Salinibius halmophilus]|uniref:3'(2'),5'-bisphosphate nucleotidase CysQ family protein n=1 Tax=Salinibius halmophilus TaxID=1853216 RepID=UPI000E663EB4|nr:3'(2'),5'-bisphosphate nucleotidase CysQ [Salinibius halmophilus]
MKSLPVWFSELQTLVEQVSQQLRADYANKDKIKVSRKSDDSPVTEADTRASQALVTGLKRMMPGVPVISEELQSSHIIASQRDTFWLVDPMDGTAEFMEGSGEFSINIALIKDGQLELGLVAMPMLEQSFYGGRQYGAFVNGAALTPRTVGKHITAVGSRRGPYQGNWQDKLEAEGYIVDRREAGAAYKFCLIAAGDADIYPRPEGIMQWDTAAAHALLQGAGGTIVDWQGQELQYGGSDLSVPAFVAVADTTILPVLTNQK